MYDRVVGALEVGIKDYIKPITPYYVINSSETIQNWRVLYFGVAVFETW